MRTTVLKSIGLMFLLVTGFGAGGCVVHEDRPRYRRVYVEHPVVVEREWVPAYRRYDGVYIEGHYR